MGSICRVCHSLLCLQDGREVDVHCVKLVGGLVARRSSNGASYPPQPCQAVHRRCGQLASAHVPTHSTHLRCFQPLRAVLLPLRRGGGHPRREGVLGGCCRGCSRRGGRRRRLLLLLVLLLGCHHRRLDIPSRNALGCQWNVRSSFQQHSEVVVPNTYCGCSP